MEKEIWKDIEDYEGIYKVSNMGNVKSLGRLKFNGRGKASKNGMFYAEKILTNNINNHGYMRVNLWKNKISKMRLVHQLVADAFLPKKEGANTDINHINGIKTDNRLCNLERCTRSHNLKHAYRLGLNTPYMKGRFGILHPNSVKVNQLDQMGNIINTFDGLTEAERKTGINRICIGNVINGKQITAGGFIWSKC